MDGACSADGGGERCVQGFGGKKLRERDHWGDPGVDGRIIIRRIFRKWNLGFRTVLSYPRIETVGGHL
jgi:hypothetical protein